MSSDTQRLFVLSPGEVYVGEGLQIALQDRPIGRLSLRVPQDIAKQIRSTNEVALDMPINRSVVTGTVVSSRLGPDEWLVSMPDNDVANIREGLTDAFSGIFHSIVDVSHRNFLISISGPQAPQIINSGCPLDLRDGAFSLDKVTRTVFGKVEIVLRRSSRDSYQIECWRSFAPYVHGFLTRVARNPHKVS